MASLEQVLASIPGLAGYQAQVNQNNATTLQNVQQAHGAMGILAQIAAQARAQRQAPMQDALLEAQVGEHRAKAAKLKQEAEFNSQIMKMGGPEALTPDQLEAFGMRANMAGLSSGIGWMKMAEQKRALAGQKAAVQGMQGQLVADAPAETEAQAIERVKAASAAGQPASVGFGENPNVIPRREGGVAAHLMDSPYVGDSAKALQQRIDAGQIRDPKQIEMWLKALTDKHVSQTGIQSGRDQRPEQKDPWKQVIRDGKPTYVRESELDPNKDAPLQPSMHGSTATGREAIFNDRIRLSANQAAKDLENVVQLPTTASSGVLGGRKQGPGILDAGREVLANKMTTQETQTYNAMATGFQRALASIEAAGLMPSGSLTHQMDAVIFKEGDTNLTKLHKLAQTRQIVETGLENLATSDRVSPEIKAHVNTIMDRVRKSVPYTHSDLIKLSVAQESNPKMTLKELLAESQKGAAENGWNDAKEQRYQELMRKRNGAQ